VIGVFYLNLVGPLPSPLIEIRRGREKERKREKKVRPCTLVEILTIDVLVVFVARDVMILCGKFNLRAIGRGGP
jgi:hypothetical protein